VKAYADVLGTGKEDLLIVSNPKLCMGKGYTSKSIYEASGPTDDLRVADDSCTARGGRQQSLMIRKDRFRPKE